MSREEREAFIEKVEKRQEELLRLIERKKRQKAEREAELAERERPRRRRFLGLI